jgi:phenylalanyl-tRNA synthetase alpha subunit
MISLVANQILYPEIVIRSTISIASNLVTSVNYLNSLIKNDSHLQKLLNLNDIIEDIGIIKSFIEEKQKQNSSKTLDICLENLGQILIDLEENINRITYKIENHKNLWFHNFRSYNVKIESENIPILIEKMNHRFEILIKISSALL